MSMQEEELRRRRGPAAGAGGEGLGGAPVSTGMLLPHMMGLPTNRGGGSGGLEAFLQQMMGGGAPGPSARNFQNSGGWLPPGQEKQLQGIGGPNLAPGNIDSGQALNQPGPGGIPPGQSGVMPPQSQSWRNYAPGYAAAAQAGVGGPNSIFGAGQRGVPSTGVGEAPGPGGGGAGRNIGVGPQAQQQDGVGQGGRPPAGGGGGPRPAPKPGGGGGGWTPPGIYNDNDPTNNPGWTGPSQQYAHAGNSTASGGYTNPVGNQGTISHAAIDNNAGAVAGKKKKGGGVGGVTSGGWQTGGGF